MLDLTIWTDISRYNNSKPNSSTIYPINFDKMRAAGGGVEGVCIRKSIGKFHDPAFEMNWQGAGDAGLKRSVYCVPYVSYDMAPQQHVMSTWPSGGMFDGVCDIPAWDDVERKHKLQPYQAIERLLPWHYAMVDTFGWAEFYTAKYVWQDFYSKRPGWQKDWGLVVANYRKDLYNLNIEQLKVMVAKQIVHPIVPIGWRIDRDGQAIPSELRWEQWQISADHNNLGQAYGVYGPHIDISFRQGQFHPPATPPPLPSSDVQQKMIALREAFGLADEAMHELEAEVFEA